MRAATREPIKEAIWRTHRKGCPRHERDGGWKGRCDGRRSYLLRFRPGGRGSPEVSRAYDRLEDAEKAKLALRDHARGRHEHAAEVEHCPLCQERAPKRVRRTLKSYALDWLGRDLRLLGIREQTRDEYERLLNTYALSYFDTSMLLSEIDTRAVQGYVDWLCKQPNRRGRKAKGTLSDDAVRNALTPLRSMLAQAVREGEISHNPCAGVKLPKSTVTWDEDEIGNGEARPFPGPNGNVMEIVVGLIPSPYRLIFELLAWTGMRRSEVLGLKGKDLHLSGGEPYVSVRRRIRRVKGKGLQAGPPKSRTSRRDIPIPIPLADKLAALHTEPEAWVFTSNGHGTPIDPDNLHSRVLRPACEEADCSWAGFHTFRHTVASRLIAEGRNVVQVSRFLGHANAHITLDVYGHLLNENVGGPLVLSGVRTESARGGRETATDESAATREAA